MAQDSTSAQLDWTIDALIDAHPLALPVLLRRGMACVGCPMAPFETLAEAAREYRVDPMAILNEVNALQGGRFGSEARTAGGCAGAAGGAGEDST